MLRGLSPGTMYEVMVCRPGFNTSRLPPLNRDGDTPFVRECGLCRTCGTTEAAYYDFDMTSTVRLNSTHVRLVCEVLSNIPRFYINWSISDPVDPNEPIILDTGDTVDEQPISIVNERQGSSGLVSTLVALDSILERDVQCTAVSAYREQSTDVGEFELEEEGKCFMN